MPRFKHPKIEIVYISYDKNEHGVTISGIWSDPDTAAKYSPYNIQAIQTDLLNE